MSFRTTASRANGDSRMVPMNTAPRTLLIPEPARIRTVAVYSVAGTTVDIQVDGVSVLAKANPASGVVPAGATVLFKFGGSVEINPGSKLTITSTDANALATASFMEA